MCSGFENVLLNRTHTKIPFDFCLLDDVGLTLSATIPCHLGRYVLSGADPEGTHLGDPEEEQRADQLR